MRECTEDCRVNSCVIKAKTRAVTNVYAIMKDPNSWANPNEFMPEGFMEFRGKNWRAPDGI
jgi:cytochrome P450